MPRNSGGRKKRRVFRPPAQLQIEGESRAAVSAAAAGAGGEAAASAAAAGGAGGSGRREGYEAYSKEEFRSLTQEASDAQVRATGFEAIDLDIGGKKIRVWLDPRNTRPPCLFTGMSTHYAPVLAAEAGEFRAF